MYATHTNTDRFSDGLAYAVPMKLTRRGAVATGGSAALTALGGCVGSDGMAGLRGEPAQTDWTQTELTDVQSEETFSISDLSTPHVLVASFAVWCPVCTRQHREIGDLVAAQPDRVTAVSLNTDPNEDAETVQTYLSRREFEWRFAIASIEMVEQLVDEFGSAVIDIPSTPVIHVWPNGQRELLESPAYRPLSTDDLSAAIEAGA